MQELDPGIYHCPSHNYARQPGALIRRSEEKDCSPVDVPEAPAEPETPLGDPLDSTPIQFATFISMMILSTAYEAMMDFLTSRVPEAGGMLLGAKGHDLITHFIADLKARVTAVSYQPAVDWLNPLLRQFVACGSDAKGMVHSHPAGIIYPSYGDIEHVRSTLARAKNAKADAFFLPIVCSGRLYPYVIMRDRPTDVQIAKLVIV